MIAYYMNDGSDRQNALQYSIYLLNVNYYSTYVLRACVENESNSTNCLSTGKQAFVCFVVCVCMYILYCLMHCSQNR